ncbi:MAG: aminotransferase class III-fold pyridoxal phosphate-dependent enzyme [Leucobacter sp.]
MLNHTNDIALRERATQVIPGGMYGHMNMAKLPDGYPQFMSRGVGAHLYDADDNRYIDYMCGWGPIVLGRQNTAVDKAVVEQLAQGDIFNGPGESMVDLAELLVDVVPHADWVLFAKNGTDATTACVTTARAHTGKSTVLLAIDGYHGAIPWCTPNPNGVTDEDRANQIRFEYNNIESLLAAADEAGDDFAAVILAPVHQPSNKTNAYATAEFAQAVRELCDSRGALLILDEVRAGFRIDLRGSWQRYGVEPDLCAWSKAIANGYPLSAVTGREPFREAAGSIYVTGSFWFSASSMAAAIATITQLRETDALAQIERIGTRLVEGLRTQAAHHGHVVDISGPPQMPLMLFTGEGGDAKAARFSNLCIERGVYLHPTHNWFVSAAHTDADIEETLAATEAAFIELSR